MIVTPLIASGFKATMPKGANLDADPEGENEVILGIDDAGNYFIDGRAVPTGTLEDQLRSRYETREKDKILYLKADNQLQYGKVQDAVETARKAGVRVIAAVTDRQGGLLDLGGPKKGGK
jgi:biopolymer transport protein ExbD